VSAELRALAEKATPGPWRQGYREGKYVYTGVDDFLTGPIRAENAAYIAAASPDVILVLLDERDAAIRRAEEAERTVRVLAAKVMHHHRRDQVNAPNCDVCRGVEARLRSQES
jgi:hypothetical protein